MKVCLKYWSKLSLPIRINLIASLVVGLILFLLSSQLRTDGFPISAQFGEFQFKETIDFLNNTEIHGDSSTAYRLFTWRFILDFIWPILFFVLLFQIAREYLLGANKGVFLIILMFCAILFDYWENIIYLMGEEEPELLIGLRKVEVFKILCYALVIMAMMYFIVRLINKEEVLRQKFKDAVTGIWEFIQQSFISILMILVIFILMTNLDQGASVIIELTMNPFNLFFTFILILFLAIVLSHYPSYMRVVLHKHQEKISWHMKTLYIKKGYPLPVGLIWFSPTNDKRKRSDLKEKLLTKILRHSLGLMVLSALMYIFLFIGDKFDVLSVPPKIAYFVFLFTTTWYYCLHIKKKNDGDSDKVKEKYTKQLQISFLVTALLLIISVIISIIFNWSAITIVSSLITILSMMFLYMHFRLIRGDLICTVPFIKRIAIVGLVTIVALFVINIYIELAVIQFNPLLILILYLINIYGLTMLILKHLFYYWDKDNTDGEDSPRVKHANMAYILPVVVTFLVLWCFFIAPKQSSDQHTIQTYSLCQKEQISESEFLTALEAKKNNKFFQLSGYGGGLKANLWTMLALRQITQDDPGFLDRTISMSGTSGGMMGIGNFAALYLHDTTSIYHRKMDSIIFAIGRFDHLSIDFTYLLGKDLLKEFLPFKKGYYGSDRSDKSMQYYSILTGVDGTPKKSYSSWFQKQFAKITGRTRVKDRIPFRNRYYQIFKKTGYFPAIFINTYAVSGSQGVALSITGATQNSQSINLLDDNKQISYFGALSTTNRFPVFSPTAKIDGKGNFLDGGYLDNSGLTSTLGFKKHLLSQKNSSTKNSKLINSLGLSDQNIRQVIVNSGKVDYIKSLFDDSILYENGIEVEQVGEVPSIVNGIVGVNKMPWHQEGVVGKEAIRIFLPHLISYEDVMNVYKGKPKVDPAYIIQTIQLSNKKVKEAIEEYNRNAETDKQYHLKQWGIVQPALARLNSKPEVIYQLAMVRHHCDLKRAIKSIRAWR